MLWSKLSLQYPCKCTQCHCELSITSERYLYFKISNYPQDIKYCIVIVNQEFFLFTELCLRSNLFDITSKIHAP